MAKTKANWELYPDFSWEEFDDGGPEPPHEFLIKLQSARDICSRLCTQLGFPETKFHINSGSRSEEVNQRVGGKPDSTHLYGRACDIAAEGSRAQFLVVKSLMLAGFTRIGVYKEKSFIHVDDGELEPQLNRSSHVLF